MDTAFSRQILRALIRDRQFLKRTQLDLQAEWFTELPEKIIVEACLDFYKKHEAPIQALISFDAIDLARSKYKASIKTQQELRKLITELQSGTFESVPASALEERVRVMRREAFYDDALQNILEAQEKGLLDASLFQQIVDRSAIELANSDWRAVDVISDTELEQRIERRKNEKQRK